MDILSNSSLDCHSERPFIVTDIKPALKNSHRVNVFINQKYSFSLDLTQLVGSKLKTQQTLSQTELDQYQQLSRFGKLYQRTLEWVLLRPRSIHETQQHLRLKTRCGDSHQFSESEITQIINTLIDKAYLDDAKFAAYYVENRFLKKGISERRLRQELAKKGISQTLIDQTLQQSARTDASEIQKIITKKRQKYSDDQLIQYLLRQGFDCQTVRNAVHETD